jgi:hypothetical protein
MNKLTALTIEEIYNDNVKAYHPVILKSDTEMILVAAVLLVQFLKSKKML